MPKNAVNSVALSGVAALVKASGRKALGISAESARCKSSRASVTARIARKQTTLSPQRLPDRVAETLPAPLHPVPRRVRSSRSNAPSGD